MLSITTRSGAAAAIRRAWRRPSARLCTQSKRTSTIRSLPVACASSLQNSKTNCKKPCRRARRESHRQKDSRNVGITINSHSSSCRQRPFGSSFERQQPQTICHVSRASMSESLEEVTVLLLKSVQTLQTKVNLSFLVQMGFRDRIATVFRFLADQPEAKTLVQAAQFASTLLFVVLYIWSTYSPPPLWSIRYNLDLFLCIMFAIDYVSRFLVRATTSLLHWKHCSFESAQQYSSSQLCL